MRCLPHALATTLALAASLGACDRAVDLRDEPRTFPQPSTPGSKDVKLVDTDLGTSAHAECAERPLGECVGPSDFPCAFDGWIQASAESCQLETDCRTNGTLVVRMDEGGCVSALLMDQPNDEVVACLVEKLGDVRCPCAATEASYYFGIGNVGCGQEPPPG